MKSTGANRQLRQLITEVLTGHRTLTWTVNDADRAINLNQDLVLDQGTWTPAITFATPGDLAVTHVAQIGNWFRIGNHVKASFQISTSAFTHTTASGNLQVTGLGSVPLVAVNNMFGGSMQWRGITKANYTDICPTIDTSTITFVMSGSAQPISNVVAADMPTGGAVVLRGSVEFLLA
jgi:hypothetical protein